MMKSFFVLATAVALSVLRLPTAHAAAPDNFDSCVSQCQATFGKSIKSSSVSSSSASNSSSSSSSSTSTSSNSTAATTGTPLVAGPGQVVVAPIKGDLRFVPFAVNAAAGTSIEYVWGAGPHTVTQSSALSLCNKTLESDAFTPSGPQNATFKFPVTVAQSSSCSVPQHCQKGMFGIINPTQSSTADASFSAIISSMAAKDSKFADMVNTTATLCGDNTQAAEWGGKFATSTLPEWALESAMTQVLLTRQFFAANPHLLAASSSSATSSSEATSATSLAASSLSAPISTGVSAAEASQASGVGNKSTAESSGASGRRAAVALALFGAAFTITTA